jgi:hypothetical protein
MNEHFRAIQWSEGSINVPGTPAVLRTTIVRSYDAKKLYHRPEKHLFDEAAVDFRSSEYLDVEGGAIPIHRAHYSNPGRANVAAYLLVYESRPVSNPYIAQFAALPLQMLRGPAPMTLFFVSGFAPENQAEAVTAAAKQWLALSWQRYRTSCLAPGAEVSGSSGMRTTPKGAPGAGSRPPE